MRSQLEVKNPISTNGLVQIGTGTIGNVMVDKLESGFSQGPIPLPFARFRFFGFSYNAFGNMVGNAPQAAAEGVMSTEQKKP